MQKIQNFYIFLRFKWQNRKNAYFFKKIFVFLKLGKDAGVVELARLESVCTGNRTVGSNPTLSAKIFYCIYYTTAY